MKKGFAVFSLLLSACLPLSAEADDECYPETGTVNICDFAREVADSMATELPMKMSQNLTMEKVMAMKNIVGIHVALGYDESYLMSVSKDGSISMGDLAKAMKSSVKANLCQEESLVSKFIYLGGKVHYSYRYSDGTPYLTIKINEC